MLNLGLLVLVAYAALGLVVSLIVHVAATMGWRPDSNALFFALHIGIFPMAIPMVLIASKLTAGMKNPGFQMFNVNSSYWNTVYAGCPAWLKYLTYGFYIYAFASFAYFIFTAPYGQQPPGSPSSSIWRGFSGHWMFFYCAGLAVLMTAYRCGLDNLQPKCRNGHPVGHEDTYCASCGVPVGTRWGRTRTEN